MANVRNGNTIYVDSTGSLLTDKNVRVYGIFYTSNAAEDAIILKDADNSGDLKLKIQVATAKQTIFYDFHNTNVFFPNGIYVSSLSASSIATILYQIGGSK